jgi:hypothetical protein
VVQLRMRQATEAADSPLTCCKCASVTRRCLKQKMRYNSTDTFGYLFRVDTAVGKHVTLGIATGIYFKLEHAVASQLIITQ